MSDGGRRAAAALAKAPAQLPDLADRVRLFARALPDSRKLGLKDGPELKGGIDKVLETYGKGNRNKHRAVVYYLLAKHFRREAAYA